MCHLSELFRAAAECVRNICRALTHTDRRAGTYTENNN